MTKTEQAKLDSIPADGLVVRDLGAAWTALRAAGLVTITPHLPIKRAGGVGTSYMITRN